MVWLAFFSVLAVISAVLVLASVNQLRFARRVRGEIRALLAMARESGRPEGEARLPAPVERYREVAVGHRAPVRTLTLRHGGTFCTRPGAKPLPIRGTQVFTASPPGFVWSARVRMAPGVWIDARDMLMANKGSMRVLLDDSVPLADAQGAAIDQAAALRLLAEMPWFPTAMFDRRYVQWSAIDSSHARATLRLDGQEVSCVFEFGPDGLPIRATAERPRETGELRPWGGTYSDYRSVDGMRVPFEAEVTWQLVDGPFTYAHWQIESFEYDGEPLASRDATGLTQERRAGSNVDYVGRRVGKRLALRKP